MMSSASKDNSLNRSVNKSLDVSQLGMSYNQSTPWRERSMKKI